VPEPHPRPGERREWRVMRLAALVVAALILVIVLYAILR
jgi:hypothetical protein